MLSRLGSGKNHTNTLLVESSDPRIRHEKLWKLLGRRIQFHPVFVRMTGSVTASLMLSQGFYWTRNWLLEHPHADGWFWKKQTDWEAETGLSRKEQETARRILRELGFIQEKKEGMPAKLHFRLDLNQIALSVQPDASGQVNWQDDAAVFELLGSPIVFHRSLVDIIGSATASLMLSHATVQTARILKRRPDGWFWKSRDEWQRETGLTRWEQESARKALKAIELLEEKRTLEIHDRDSSRVMYYRVNLKRLEELLSKPETVSKSNDGAERWEPGKQDCEFPAINKVGTGQTGLLESSNQQGGNRANSKVGTGQTVRWESGMLKGGNRATLLAPKPPYRLPENLPPIKETEITPEITQQLPPPAAVETEPMDSCCGDGRLVFPKQLDPAIREVIGERLISECPGDAQAILDVMANSFQSSKGVSNPAYYLNSLIERAKHGAFDPLPGLAVARAREEQERQRAKRLEAEKQILAETALLESRTASSASDGYKSASAAAFFASYRAKQKTIIAPTVANSPTDARQASTLTQLQQETLSKKPLTPLLSSGRKLVLLGSANKAGL